MLFALRFRKVVFWRSDVDQSTDLEAALGFVIRRIEDQAEASGHAINEEEHSPLENLPHKSIILSLQSAGLQSLFRGPSILSGFVRWQKPLT